MKALLQDATRCIGCRACQVACKQWNQLPAEKTEFFAGPGYQNPRDLSASTWTLITYNEVEKRGRFEWVFGRLICMHCQDPACASACPVAALEKTPEGPVIYHAGRCIGCRYCMLACPFQVPKFQWDKALPLIQKCNMCAERIAEGLKPACATACPTGAITFGERDELIGEAEKRISSNPSNYTPYIYGKDEVGGTCVLHISDVPFDILGYRMDLPEKPLPSFTSTAMKAIPEVIVGLGVVLGAAYGIIKRRVELQQEEESDVDTEE